MKAAQAMANGRPKPTKVLVQKGYEDLYFVEKKVGKIVLLGDKPELDDADDWAVLRRELKDEAGFTTIALAQASFFASGTNYFHVRTDQDPEDGDACVVGLT